MGRHDSSYRSFFKNRSMIRDLLVEIVDEPWVHSLDLDAGELVDGALIAESHESRATDVVWRFPFKERDAGEIYILLEIQSQPDATMPVRLMGYEGLLYQRLLDNRVVSIRNPLPLIVPVILYNGLGPWNGPTDLGSLIGEAGASAEIYRPQLRFLLIDERRFSPERLEGLSSPVACLFRIEQSRDWDELHRNVSRLRQSGIQPSLRRTFQSWLRRVILPRFKVTAEDSAHLTLEEIETMLAERIDQWNREMVEKGIQIGIQKGIQEGIQKGRQEGIQKGIQKGKAEALLQQLGLKFGPISPEIQERVAAADSDRLLEWSGRILTAERLEDVFGE
jgi:predicted transposase YdaD